MNMLTIFFRNQVVHKKIRRQGGKNILIHVYLTNLFFGILKYTFEKETNYCEIEYFEKNIYLLPPSHDNDF